MNRLTKSRSMWLGLNVMPHEPALRSWLKRLARGNLEIDDIVQETYAALASLDSVDHISNPRSYAFQTAYSVVHKQFRRSNIVSFSSLSDIDASLVASETPTPEHEAAARAELRQVAALIDKMPPRCREVLVLKRIQCLSHADIAHRLGISESAVEKYVAKGLRLLLESFDRSGTVSDGASHDETVKQRAAGSGRSRTELERSSTGNRGGLPIKIESKT
jgi:RNA polymerase sigma factor (sigma-70 family)